jgi:HAE1 family hydrophobic/amphiphilic exporter-1
LLLAGSLYAVRSVGTELTPKTDDGQLNINISLAQGTKFELTNQLVAKVEDKLKSIPEIDTVFTTVGGSGGGGFQTASTNSGSIQVQLKPLSERTRSTDQVIEQVRTLTQGNPGAQINVSARSAFNLPGGGGFGGGGDIQIGLSGPDLNVLQKLGDSVVDDISDIPGIRGVQNTLDRTTPEFDLNIDRDAAAHYGISVKEIMTSLRTAYQGSVATQFKTGDSQIAVLVQYPTDFTNSIENINKVVLITSSGTQVMLNQVATVSPGSGPAQIRHQNQARTASVSGSVFGAAVGDVSKLVQARIAEIQPPEGYQITMGGQQTSINSSFKSLGLMLILSIILVYMVMASQFESFYGPFIIMFSLPPTFIGAVVGLLVTHRTINMNSIIGMIMLIGIVVNNAIVLVDYTNQLRKRGLSLEEALISAGKIRLRPILMTTCTTVLAMLPLVIGRGSGAETQASMATVVAFGLTLSTLVTLVLVPVVYMTLDHWGNRFKRMFRKNSTVLAPPADSSVSM